MSTSGNEATYVMGAWGKYIVEHPTTPLMYFKPFKTTITPELDFNSTPYFANHFHYGEGLCIPPNFLRDQLSNSLELMTTTYIPKSLMEVAERKIRPAYYPDLSNLEGYLHKGVGPFAKWLCENSSNDENEFIPKDIVPIFYLKPLVDPGKLPIYTFSLQERHVFLGAKTAAIHVMEVHNLLKALHVNVHCCITEKKKVKYSRISFQGFETDVESSRCYLPSGSNIIVWNARNVHRPSFMDTFYEIFSFYAPVLVVVTEARFDQSTLEYLKFQLRGVYDVEGFGGHNGYSEVLLIWDKKELFPWVTKRGNSYFGHQLGVEIESVTRGGRALTPPLPYSPYSGGDPTDDPSIHDWNDHLTPSPKPASPSTSGDYGGVGQADTTVHDLNNHLTP